MKRSDLTEKLLDIKREKGWTCAYICGEIMRHVAGAEVVGALLRPER